MSDIVDAFRPVLGPETLPPFQEIYEKNSDYFAWSCPEEVPGERLFPHVPAHLLGVIFTFKPDGAPIGFQSRKMVATDPDNIPIVAEEFVKEVGPFQLSLEGLHAFDELKKNVFGIPPSTPKALDLSYRIPVKDGVQTIAGFAVMRAVESKEILSAMISPKKTLEQVGLLLRQDIVELQKVFNANGFSLTDMLDLMGSGNGARTKQLLQGDDRLKQFAMSIISGSLPPVELMSGGGRVEKQTPSHNSGQATTGPNRAQRRAAQKHPKRQR